MRSRYALLTLLFCTAIFATPFQAAIDFSGGIEGPVTPVNLAFYGSVFTVGSDPILVSALGLHVVADPSGGIVRIYKNGTQTDLVTATVDSNDLLSDDGRYRFETFTPVLLQANTSYVVISHFNNGQRIIRHATGLTTQAGITFLGARAGGTAVPYPVGDGEAGGPYLVPTFEFTIQSSTPEPSTMGLFAIAFLAAGVMKVRRRQ